MALSYRVFHFDKTILLPVNISFCSRDVKDGNALAILNWDCPFSCFGVWEHRVNREQHGDYVGSGRSPKLLRIRRRDGLTWLLPCCLRVHEEGSAGVIGESSRPFGTAYWPSNSEATVFERARSVSTIVIRAKSIHTDLDLAVLLIDLVISAHIIIRVLRHLGSSEQLGKL